MQMCTVLASTDEVERFGWPGETEPNTWEKADESTGTETGLW